MGFLDELAEVSALHQLHGEVDVTRVALADIVKREDAWVDQLTQHLGLVA